MAKKTSRTMPKGLTRQIIAGANPAAGAKEFALPRSSEDLSITNLGLDLGDWYAPTATMWTEEATGLEDYSPTELTLLTGAGMIPFVGKFAKEGDKLYKGAKKVYDGLDMLPEQMYKQAAKEAYAAGDRTKMSFNNGRAQKYRRGEALMYATPEAAEEAGSKYQRKLVVTAEPRMATTAGTGIGSANATALENVTPVSGPYTAGNTGTAILNTGSQLQNTNTVKTKGHSGTLTGARGYQGEMYDPRRTLVNTNEYGPFPWEADPYSKKLDNIMNKNEGRYEFMMNKTRKSEHYPNKPPALSKDEAVAIAMSTGRPDWATRIMNDTEYFISPRDRGDFNTLHSQMRPRGNMPAPTIEQIIDIGNRGVEKELREMFISLPDNQKRAFASHYGVPDIYEDWLKNRDEYTKAREKLLKTRKHREQGNARYDQVYRQ